MSGRATAIQLLGSGISRAAADGRYVPRYIAAAGTVMATVLGSSIGVLESTNIIGVAQPASLRLKSFNGTAAAPTAILTGDVIASIRPQGYHSGGDFASGSGILHGVATEDFTATAQGIKGTLRATRLGTTTNANLLDYSHPAAGVTELLSRQTALRIIPTATGTVQMRNRTNTANVIETGADTLGLFNVAPIARPTITGARAGNAALASLLTQGALLGAWIDSTTA